MKWLTSFFVGLIASVLPAPAQSADPANTPRRATRSTASPPPTARVHGDCRSCHINGDLKSERSWWQRSYRMPDTVSGARSQLDNISRLCLSCHDGVTAGDVPTKKGGRLIIGMNLADDHPVGVVYPPRNRRGKRFSRYHMPPRGSIAVYGSAGSQRIQCLSCHTPHPGRYPKLLRESMVGSALCLKCHDL